MYKEENQLHTILISFIFSGAQHWPQRVQTVMAALHFLSKTIKLFFSFWMNSNSFSVLNSTFTVIYFVCLNFLFFFYRFSFWNREKHKIKPNICESFNSQGHYISFSSAITIIYLDYQDIAWWGEQKYCTLKQTYPEWKRQHLRDPF